MLRKRWRFFVLAFLSALGLAIASWFLSIALNLRAAAARPVDAFFVLGGSIQREIYVAELAKKSPQIPILISHGSEDPCIWLIFQRENAPMERVLLEHCARNTFGNFYFGVPILDQWGVHKVKLITSQTHLPRAQWLAQILFGARGIWVETDIAQETGVPGNTESWVKTTLDVTRSLLWAIAGQFVRSRCTDTIRLVDVDLEMWRKRGFKCEHQANLDEKK
jgi:uncharacterized SAM-binding protein YcdF (DUF218 family)